ncbi:aspartate dehydrogenase [uncultured Sulfitobacter sp.]|uniref:aspartate dehydrogenase n=1 Tax=uncultured Sulfitobacter sp. TaxID=191468 RepID=UPI0025958317|nr:aspartate dehydrogenase [uncultured Sulfitobacter sp.]
MNDTLRTGPRTRVAVAGLGAVGMKVVNALNDGMDGFELAAIAVRDVETAKDRIAHLRAPVPLVSVDELEQYADIVVECAPANLLHRIAEPFLRAGKKVILLSCGALLENEYLIDVAKQHGGQIIVPSGALLGLDAVSATALGTIHSVRMTTRKPVRGLLGAPHLIKNNIDIEHITEPMMVFDGTAREAAIGFPANLNVAVALSLAGSGPDSTQLQIWADPNLSLNTHHIEVTSDSANLSMSIQNIPTNNPKTGRITALSVIATLQRLSAPLRVGT